MPVFAFQPERADGLEATMVVEIADCDTENCWTFQVHDGHLHPSRSAAHDFDVRLKTDTSGFFRFLGGRAAPGECGSLEGPSEVAEAIQACFLRS
jgi:hypothetical protein